MCIMCTSHLWKILNWCCFLCCLQAADAVWSHLLCSRRWWCSSWQSSLPWLWRADAESDLSDVVGRPATWLGEWSSHTSHGVWQTASVLMQWSLDVTSFIHKSASQFHRHQLQRNYTKSKSESSVLNTYIHITVFTIYVFLPCCNYC